MEEIETEETTEIETPSPAVEAGQQAVEVEEKVGETTTQVEGEQSTAEPTDEAGEQEDEHKKPPRGVQKRLDELTREKYEAKREADYWREQVLSKKTDAVPPPVVDEKPEAIKPNPDSYENYNDYLEALTDWKVDLKLKAGRQEAVREQIQLEKIRQKKAVQQSFKQAAAKAEEKYSDFKDVVTTSTAPCTDHMLNAMQESDLGPEIMYHLAKNPAEAERIAGLPEYSQVREIGKLEAKLSGISPPEPRRITRTTEPVRIVSGANVSERDPNKMSMEDYAKWRLSQMAQ